MQKTLYYCLLCFFLLVACKREGYHLPQDKMQAVLTDIQIAEVYSTQSGYDTVLKIPAKNDDSLAAYYGHVLHHHNITLEQFKQSLDWYRQHPDVLDSIYVRAVTKIGLDSVFTKPRAREMIPQ